MVLKGGRKQSQLVIIFGWAAGHCRGPSGAAAELAMQREAVHADGAADLRVDSVDMMKGCSSNVSGKYIL